MKFLHSLPSLSELFVIWALRFHSAPLCLVCQGKRWQWRVVRVVASCVLGHCWHFAAGVHTSCCLPRRSRQLCVEISCCCRLLSANAIAQGGGVACQWKGEERQRGTQAVGHRSSGVRTPLVLGSISLNCGSYEHGILIISLDWATSCTPSLPPPLVLPAPLCYACCCSCCCCCCIVSSFTVSSSFLGSKTNIRRTFFVVTLPALLPHGLSLSLSLSPSVSVSVCPASVCILHSASSSASAASSVWLRKCQVKWLRCTPQSCTQFSPYLVLDFSPNVTLSSAFKCRLRHDDHFPNVV